MTMQAITTISSTACRLLAITSHMVRNAARVGTLSRQIDCASCLTSRCNVGSSTHTINKRQQHTVASSGSVLDTMSRLDRVKWNMGFYGKLQVSNSKLKMSGLNLYVCCTDFIDFPNFVADAKLPDTFNSWFLLMQLHLWMLNVKLSQMGKEGVLLKQYIYTAMWHNVEERLNLFKDLLGSEKRKYIQNYYGLMLMNIMCYDEGILGSDKQLANALWTQLYGTSPDVDPKGLELMVEYVRKQVYHHDNLDPLPIMSPGYISFLPLHGDKIDKAKSERDLQTLKEQK